MTDRPSGKASELPIVNRSPVLMPGLPAEQEFGWHVLLDLDDRDIPWVLVGGQITLLHCLENGITGYRPTDDGDVVLDVWTRRDAVRTAGQWLQITHDFEPTETMDGFAYRFTRGDTKIDLLVPEGLEHQRRQPMAIGSRPALPVDGGNQALLRLERLPVQVGWRSGHIRRPNLLGALVVKAAAFVADSRDPERHAEDIALLTHAALDSGSLRDIDTQARPHDRKRLRDALTRLPTAHVCWRSRPEPLAVHDALTRLTEPR